jgi:hypothetical protein
MLSKVLALFRSSPREPLREMVDPILGPCVPDQEERWWRASLEANGRRIDFTLGGELEPNPLLLAHAHQIVGELDAFEKRVREFLKQEGARFKEADVRDEVEGLTIDDVCLLRADRPSDGMIYFKGPSEYRLWHCDYVDGRCQDLSCDT